MFVPSQLGVDSDQPMRELEDFLLDTELADALRARRTSYWKTFLRLLRY